MSLKKYIQDMSIQFLLGCTLRNWLKLIRQNSNKMIYWKSIPKFLYITFVIIIITPLRIMEKMLFDKRIKKTVIKQAPVFVLGHWRSGTTYLVNILSQDPQFGVTNAIHCFTPSIFLCCYDVLDWLLRKILPRKRPMDDVVLDTVSSQEEEFAIANMTTLSNYHFCLFPRNYSKYQKYASFDGLTEEELTEWKANYLYLLKKVTLQLKNKQLLLKSPTNTSRIKQLLEIFPDAKFINIYRNPYTVFLSTKRLYDKFFPLFALQKQVTSAEAEEVQFEIYEKMYEKYFLEKKYIPTGNLIEVKYEDMVKNPLESIKKIYEGLNLPKYEKAKSLFQSYIDSLEDYEPNEHHIDDLLKEKISKRFAFTIKGWGYDSQ